MKTHSKSIFNIFTLFALLASLIGGAVFVTPVYAAGYVVNTLNDNTTAGDGFCTLREAIASANNAGNGDCGANSAADTITFSVSGTITLGSQLPNIVSGQGTLTINGGGNITISGNNAVRVLQVLSGATLTLQNLTIANGSADRAGVMNDGTLIITNSTFSGNNSTNNGGGINNSSVGTVTITNSTFSGNTAANRGGGIFSSAGTMTLKNTIVANSTSGGNCNGVITNGGNNIDSGTTCGWGSNSGSMSSTNPNLGGALADNGGPTKTFKLLNGANGAPATDQRGLMRPQGERYDIGAYEAHADSTPSTVMSNSLVASYTTGPSSFTVTFSEDVYNPAGNTDTDDVTNPNNYLLVEDGVNATFNTFACIGGLVADDTQVTVTSVTYTPNTSIVNLGSALPNGTYRLFVCGTTSIVDLALNPLNGGADTTFNFIVAPATAGTTTTSAASLPNTGYAPHKVTSLPAQPASLAYTDLGSIWIEIPSQNIKSAIVGVPKTDKGWDTTWLANDTGWLNGTAFPTWEGNSVLTAHVINSNGLPGPFANLKELKYGDQIIVNLYGQQYIFEVRNTRLSRPTTTNFALEDLEDYSYLTLVTCQGYNPLSDSYLFRRIVRAVLVSVK